MRGHRRQPRASASRSRGGSAPRGPACCSSRARRSALEEARGRVLGRRRPGRGCWRSTSPSPTPASASSPPPAERFGQLDVLVNNAGTAKRRSLDEVPDEDWQAAWELNVMAPLRAMRRRRPGMAERGWGRDRQRLLVRRQAAIGDDARVLGHQGGGALAVARCSPTRYAEHGVLVNADLPRADQVGAVDGARRPPRPVRRARRRRSRDEALAAAGAGRPIGRLAEVAEIADAIVFLCSERASYVAGAAWSVDGGTVQVII